MSKTYTVRLPFRVPPESRFVDLDAVSGVSFLGCHVSLTEVPPDHVLEIRGISTLEEAKAFMGRAYSGLMWAGLDWGIGIYVPSLVPQHLHYFPDPIAVGKRFEKSFGLNTGPIDTIIDKRQPSLISEKLRFRWLTGGEVRVQLTHKLDQFVTLVNLGAEIDNDAKVQKSPKTRLALDLYSLSHFESSEFAKYVTRCTVIEILASTDKAPKAVVEMVEKLQRYTETEAEGSTDPNTAKQLRALLELPLFDRTRWRG